MTKKNGTEYLDAEFAEVQAALSQQQALMEIGLICCDNETCSGAGRPGDPCPLCKFVLPNPKKGSTVLGLPPATIPVTPSVSPPGTHPAWQGYSGGKYEYHEHDGTKVVFEHAGKKLYAANSSGLDEYSSKYGLIIDLARNIRWVDEHGFVKEKSSKKFDVLRKYTFRPKKIPADVLDLDWLDMSAPPCSLDFWIKLWEILPEHTVIACVGGHGRTGTALAALILASGQKDYYDAIDWVRTEHCGKAIESLAQEQYLHKLYVEMLKRNIKHETDPDILTILNEDLQWAETHVPNSFSSYGDPPPAKVDVPVSTTTDDKVKVFPARGNSEQDNLKLVGGLLYEKMCTHAACVTVGCQKKDHQGWVEYDPDLDSTLWGV